MKRVGFAAIHQGNEEMFGHEQQQRNMILHKNDASGMFAQAMKIKRLHGVLTTIKG